MTDDFWTLLNWGHLEIPGWEGISGEYYRSPIILQCIIIIEFNEDEHWCSQFAKMETHIKRKVRDGLKQICLWQQSLRGCSQTSEVRRWNSCSLRVTLKSENCVCFQKSRTQRINIISGLSPSIRCIIFWISQHAPLSGMNFGQGFAWGCGTRDTG